MTQNHNNRAQQPSERYGSFDVPLTVWTVAGAAEMTAHLFAELKPARGPILIADLPGWAAICRTGRRAVVFGTDRGTFARTRATLPPSKQGLALFQAADADSTAVRIAKLDRASGLALSSARALTWPGVPAAIAGVLGPEGILAVIGRTDVDAVLMAEFNRPDPDGEDEETASALGLDFAGYLVAASKGTFDTAVASAVAREAMPQRPCVPLTRHFDIAIWTRSTTGTGGVK